MSTLYVNGELVEVPLRTTLGELMARREQADARGIAVAVDGEVVPRGEWGSYELTGEARVEIVAATQGG